MLSRIPVNSIGVSQATVSPNPEQLGFMAVCRELKVLWKGFSFISSPLKILKIILLLILVFEFALIGIDIGAAWVTAHVLWMVEHNRPYMQLAVLTSGMVGVWIIHGNILPRISDHLLVTYVRVALPRVVSMLGMFLILNNQENAERIRAGTLKSDQMSAMLSEGARCLTDLIITVLIEIPRASGGVSILIYLAFTRPPLAIWFVFLAPIYLRLAIKMRARVGPLFDMARKLQRAKEGEANRLFLQRFDVDNLPTDSAVIPGSFKAMPKDDPELTKYWQLCEQSYAAINTAEITKLDYLLGLGLVMSGMILATWLLGEYATTVSALSLLTSWAGRVNSSLSSFVEIQNKIMDTRQVIYMLLEICGAPGFEQPQLTPSPIMGGKA